MTTLTEGNKRVWIKETTTTPRPNPPPRPTKIESNDDTFELLRTKIKQQQIKINELYDRINELETDLYYSEHNLTDLNLSDD